MGLDLDLGEACVGGKRSERGGHKLLMPNINDSSALFIVSQG